MDPERNRDVIVVNDRVDDEPVVVERPHAVGAVDQVTTRTFSLHAAAAGLLAVAMLVWGGVIMARTGFEGDLGDPQATMFGLTGNALSGAIVAGLGLLLLLAALSTDRAGVIFMSTLIGIAALIVAIEPSVADGELGVDRSLPVLLAISSAVVVLLATVVPTTTSRTRTIDEM